MDVKRYDATVEYGPGWDAGASAVMDEAADGDWVEFTDYAAVEAERDAATREAEICKAIIKHCGGSFVVECMLCGAPYDVRDPDWLKHDLTCPKHPMRDVERERDESHAIIRALTRALTLAVGEERAAAELEKARKEEKDA